MEKLFRVETDHFCAGAIARDGIFVDTAPILAWLRGKEERALIVYGRRKKWRVEVISSSGTTPEWMIDLLAKRFSK